MKFTCSVDIDLPRDRVIELFDNEENLNKWQDGFVSFEHLEGEKGKVGAKSKMVYKMGKKGKTFDLIETILVSNFPEEFTGRYEHIHMSNTMQNKFTVLSENKTRWEANIDYIEMKSFMLKVMAFIMPGMFKKQTQKWLNQFKTFAENEGL